MDKTTLVDTDCKAGRRVIEELEQRGTVVDVAAWLLAATGADKIQRVS